MISKFNLFQMVMVCAILSSCTAEDSLVQYPNEVPVSDALNCQLSLQMPQSRTKDNIAGFYNLYYAVYEKMSGELILSNADEPKKLKGSDKWQDVEIPVEMYDGKVYEVALWAHPENSRFADVSDLRQISIDYYQDNPIAFTTHFTVTAARTAISNLVLTNPFLKVRFRSCGADAEAARNSNYDFTQITATLMLDAVGTCYNALTGEAYRNDKVLFVNDQLKNKDFEADGDKILMDISFLTIGHSHVNGSLAVTMGNDHNVLKTTTFEKIFFQPGRTCEIEGVSLGCPIEFDITVGDWNVNTQTITFN